MILYLRTVHSIDFYSQALDSMILYLRTVHSIDFYSQVLDSMILYLRTVHSIDFYSQALDSMIVYLRTVHSIDFYSCSEYPNEDEMPHRYGILHARCVPPITKVTQNDSKCRNGSILP